MLYLLPNVLDESLPHAPFLPAALGEVVSSLQGLIAESEKSARRFLRRFVSHEQMAKIPLRLLNEHSSEKEVKELLGQLCLGQRWGLISDAGLPCIADPGANLVFLAHANGIPVETFAGPCSIAMALQLSGFSGQRFAFHGYLPREMSELEKQLREVEKQSFQATQIWIEAPYRSMKMLECLKAVLQPATHLCVAKDLTLPTQRVVTLSVAKWKSFTLDLGKSPSVFLIARFA
jgi:16S rRNA (cytidine1402-2'-O)-methyltransferase